MGFAWELANVTSSGGPDAGGRPPSSPRHRRRPHPHLPRLPGLAVWAHAAVAAVGAGSRRVKTLICTRPAMADHRRAF